MNYFERRRVLKSINAMDLIPVRTMAHEENEGRVTVLVPKFRSEDHVCHVPPDTFPVFQNQARCDWIRGMEG